MDDNYITDDVRERLIQSGLRELSEHGLESFSLRRVAIAAGVSCAAPYRHFKDKDELILGIICHVRDGFELLCANIIDAIGVGGAECVCELCRLAVRFWIGNGNFRSILMLSDSGAVEVRAEIEKFDAPIIHAITAFAISNGLTDEDREVLKNTVLSLVYGTLIRINMGAVDKDRALEIMKSKIITELLTYL